MSRSTVDFNILSIYGVPFQNMTTCSRYIHYHRPSSTGFGSKWQAFSSLQALTYKGDIEKYLAEAHEVEARILGLDMTIEDIITLTVLNGLDEKFDMWKTIIRERARNDSTALDWHKLIDGMKDTERDLKNTYANRVKAQGKLAVRTLRKNNSSSNLHPYSDRNNFPTTT